jgi:glycosyltransferase involved in cell wall biosynthesis
MRIFLLCRGYPDAGHLYNYPFLHRRVLQYRAYGHHVQVFVLAGGDRHRRYVGCSIETGGRVALARAFARFAPDCIAAHALADDMWGALASTGTMLPVFGWLHGSEMLPHYKTGFPDRDAPKRQAQKRIYLKRRAFWRDLHGDWPRNLMLVFVSDYAAQRAQREVGIVLPKGHWRVLHNPVDTALFDYRPKAAQDRFNVLSIRPFHNRSYANDLTAAAIVKMSAHPLFGRFSFSIYGDGDLFETQLAPLAGFDNVRCERRFLTQEEISALHKENGVFLVPTRMDTQGVSRDEAMSSGLVPVTNAVAAVPEFTSDKCACLLPGDDADGLARAMLEMGQNPALFLERSQNAAMRVHRQSAADIIIPAELDLMNGGRGNG